MESLLAMCVLLSISRQKNPYIAEGSSLNLNLPPGDS